MVDTHDVTEFLFFNHGSLSRTGEALGKMTEEDQRAYRNTLMRLGRAVDINAPADEPIGLEAETLFDELQKMVSRALAPKERNNPGFIDVGRDISDGHID